MPKHHGVVKAEFMIEPDTLPLECRVGLFATAATYPAYIRFSNQKDIAQKDVAGDIRGMAIKLIGVPGQKLFDDELHALTHDFILISTNAFVTKDVREFHDLIKATIKGLPSLLWFFVNPFNSHFRVLRNVMASFKKFANPLENPATGVPRLTASARGRR